MEKRFLILAFLCIMTSPLWAQANRHQLRDGNRNYKKERYDQAEVAYRRALERDSVDFRGQYNLGNALYRQGKYDDAARHYGQALQAPDIANNRRAQAFHNMGNCHLKAGLADKEQGMQHFQQAVQAYQEAMKLAPKNEDTRYNLAYALRMLRQAQQQQQGGGQQNQQNKNGQQNQQDKQQNQQDKQQNQQGQQPKDDGQDQQKQGQQRPQQQDQRKQDAERMLEAVKNNEKQTLKEQTQKTKAVTGHHSDKDW